MLSRFRISLILGTLTSLLMAIPALAGGWAVITLDQLPSGVVAGQSLAVGFTVRQHGRTPMVGLVPKVTATLGEEKLIVSAQAEGGPGHYTATLTLPGEGEWHWGIEAFTMYQPMPVLNVAPAGRLAKEATVASVLSSSAMPASLAILALGVLAAVIGSRRKSWPMITVTAVCLLTGCALLVIGLGTASRAEAQARSGFSDGRAISQVELGRQLFLAKGCITCHTNTKATRGIDYWTVQMGAPDLSKLSATPEVLRLRLKDPTLVKSDTQMPNLQLSDPEIEALIAFINSK